MKIRYPLRYTDQSRRAVLRRISTPGAEQRVTRSNSPNITFRGQRATIDDEACDEEAINHTASIKICEKGTIKSSIGTMPARLTIPKRRPYATLAKWLFISTSVFCGHIVFSQRCFYINGAWGPSMYPTLAIDGQFLLGSMRYRYGKGIQVGDVIIYNNPLYLNDHVAKRVIGMPGDLVLCKTPPGDNRRHPNELMVEVPEGHVWVTGDNLPWSRDSRAYGPVPLGLVKGKLLAKGNSPFSWTRVRNTLEPARFADDE